MRVRRRTTNPAGDDEPKGGPYRICAYSAQQHAAVPLSDYLSEWAVCQAEGGRAPIAGRLLLRDRENRIVVLSPHALLSCASLLFPVTVYFAV